MMVVFEVEHAGRCNINQLLISKVVPCWSLEAMKGAWRSDCYRSLLRDLKVVGPRGPPTESVTPGNGSPCRAPLAPSPRAQARPAAEGSPPTCQCRQTRWSGRTQGCPRGEPPSVRLLGSTCPIGCGGTWGHCNFSDIKFCQFCPVVWLSLLRVTHWYCTKTVRQQDLDKGDLSGKILVTSPAFPPLGALL